MRYPPWSSPTIPSSRFAVKAYASDPTPLACKCVRRHSDWLAHGHALLREAVRQTEAAG